MLQKHTNLSLLKSLFFTLVISIILVSPNRISAQNYSIYSIASVNNSTFTTPLFLEIQKNFISIAPEKNHSFVSNALSKTVNQTTADPEEIFLYTLNFSCPSTTAGDCDNVIISDLLPPEIEFINFPVGCTGCNYDSGAHSFTANLGTINNGSTISLDLQVRFPSDVLNGATANNTAVADYVQNSTPTTSTSATVTTTATNGIVITYDDMGFIDKSTTSISGATLAGQQGINYGHTFDTDVTNLVMEDIFPPGMFLEGFNVRDIECAPALSYNMEFLVYNTTTNSNAWVSGANNPYTTSTFNICSDCLTTPSNNFYTTAADEYVGGIRLTYPNTPGDGCFHPDFPGQNPSVTMNFAFDEMVTGVANPAPGDVIDNCATIVSDDFTSIQDCAGITINALRHNYSIFKSDETNTGPYEPGEIVRFSVTFRNSLDGDYDIVNPSMIDVLPPEYEYLGNVTASQIGGVTPNPGRITLEPTVLAEQDFMGVTGQTKITYNWDDATSNGITIEKNSFDRIIVEYDVRIRVSAPDMSSIVNTVYPVDVREDYNCTTPDTDDIDGDGNTTENICPVTESINILYPPGFAGLNSYKEVQGNLDTEFSRFPVNGQVSPNGNIEYNLCLENPLNLPETIDDIVLVDVLPHVGDRGVVANNELRESAWHTCSNPNWTTVAPANLADICAFKIEHGTSFSLAPGEETCLNINMIAPANVPLDSSIAWNSFGFVGNKENGSALLASEPIKVGIASMPFNCANPSATMSAVISSCTNSTPNNDGYLELSAVTDGDKLNFSTGNVYTGPTDYDDATALTIGALPFQFNTGLSNPNDSQDYTVRVFNGESNCFTDIVITVDERICPPACDCPATHSLCWDTSGFNEPPNDDLANFPF